MIGKWNNSGCILCLPFSSWAKGNGKTNKNTGFMPSYPNGAYQACDFTNMGAGYGYIYSEGDGYCNFDGANDYVSSQHIGAFTNASELTVEMWIIGPNTGVYQYMFGGYDAATDYWCGYFNSDNQMLLRFVSGGASRRYSSTATELITAGELNHAVFVKNGTAMALYLNGRELAYSLTEAYDLGNKTYTLKTQIGADGAHVEFNNKMFWFALYNEAFDLARVTANYKLGTDMGLRGVSYGNVMNIGSENSIISNNNIGIGIRI